MSAVASAAHADVQFEPKISVGVVHTDNLTLASDNEEAQTVYELIPAFVFSQQSARVTSSAKFSVEGYRYSELGRTEAYQIGGGNLRFALDPDNFFLDVGANRDHTLSDPTAAPITSSLLPISSNRLDRDEAFFGPAFTYQLGDALTADGRFRRTLVRYDENQNLTRVAPNANLDATTFSLDNYRKQVGFAWAVRYSSDKTAYEGYRSYEYRQATVEMGGWLGKHVRAFASGGKESPWNAPFDPGLSEAFWEVGFATPADQKVTAEVATGERSFGSSSRGRLGIKFSHGSLTFEHTDAPSTHRFDAYYSGNPLLAGAAGPVVTPAPAGGSAELGGIESLLDLLSRPGSAERFRLKSSRVTLTFDLQRTALSFGAFDESREDRIVLDGTALPDQTQTGLRASASRHFGARTSVILTLEKSRGDYSTADRVSLRNASLSTNYDISARTRLSLVYAHASEKTAQIGSGFNYSARNVSLLMTRTFAHASRNK